MELTFFLKCDKIWAVAETIDSVEWFIFFTTVVLYHISYASLLRVLTCFIGSLDFTALKSVLYTHVSMDSVSPQEAEKIRRMSSSRIQGKLAEHLELLEIDESRIYDLSRSQLMEAMAELTLRLAQTGPDNPVKPVNPVKPEGLVSPRPDNYSQTDIDGQLKLMEIQLQMQREQHSFEREQAREQRQHEKELKLAEIESRKIQAAESKKNDHEPIVTLKRYAECLRATIQKQPQDSCLLAL